MWKPTFLCIIFLCIYSVASAQYPSYKYRFGLQCSPTINWMSTNDKRIVSGGSKAGFRFGFVAEYYFSKSYSVTGGLGFFFNQGGTLKYNNAGNYWPNITTLPDSLRLGATPIAAGSTINYHLKYIELPFGLKMRTRDFGYWRFFAELPVFTIGILTSASGDLKTNTTSRTDENAKSAISSMNISWGVGLGSEYEISEKTSISAGLYFNQGFADLTKDSNVLIKQDSGNAIAESSKAISNNILLKIALLF